MSLKLVKLVPTGAVAGISKGKTARLGEILVRSGAVDPGDLFKALTLQQFENLRLGEMLAGLNFAKEGTILAALAEQSDLAVIDLKAQPPNPDLRTLIPPGDGLKAGFLLWKRDAGVLSVAVSDPGLTEGLSARLHHLAPDIRFVLAPRRDILGFYRSEFASELSRSANADYPAALSIRRWQGRKPKVVGAVLAAVFALVIFFNPGWVMAGLLGWIMATLVANSASKLVLLAAYLTRPKQPAQNLRPKRLPKISILVPILRETNILGRLIQRMSALKYPKELLDICLVYEADDAASRAHIAQCTLPPWMHAIEVPQSTIQTKPRAMNFALDFCKGDIIGVYDAEDAPEPDQLYQVLSAFESGGEDVACVQCQLDFFNTGTNWLSRCFTIEYSILFRVLLPAMQRLGLPIPLGGTSMFFKRDKLEELGRWDAHNVTEDADLGMRLRRFGYRCLVSPATTYEEANFRTIPWIKQRSRWLKGYLQTWIAHMRDPVGLWRALGPVGFLYFQVLFLGTFTSFAAVPLVLPLWVLSFGVELAPYRAVPPGFLSALVALFIFTELLLLVIGAVAVFQRGTKKLLVYLPCMLIYWPLGCFAAYKALWELFAKPVYWDKTMHGINDHAYQHEIERLTGNNAAPEPAPKA